ncbi:MAG TPA: OmpA family protein [Acetobacteraceae bacterium]|nr:OmpA family protein [Acetobacteraceae bacterium]
MTFRGALLAAAMLALPVAASAQPVTGPYISLGAGVNLMQDEHMSGMSVAGGGVAGASGNLDLHPGPAFVAAMGWGFGNGLRAEIEGNYRYNAFYGSSGFGPAVTHFGGHEQKFGGMVNVLYDFVGLTPMLQPYVGAGIGYEGVSEQNLHSFGDTAVFSGSNSTKGSFAYQVILGAAVPIQAMPGLALTAEYRFMGLVGDRSYGGTGTALSPLRTGAASVTMNDDFNHTFLIGVRYNFGQAPAPAPMAAPAAAPAPAVQPARSYLVFFDWDKATLTERARQIIHEAAENSTRVQYTQIAVNGYTDTSGTAKYNMGLSIRRAQAVAAELVRDGVPRNAIVIKGFGETHLLVPTGEGVREPQNRRVEIIIR